MTTVDAQIRNADQAICDNIAKLEGNRPLLSQNLLSQARNLIEAVAVRLYTGDGTIEFTYEASKPALLFVGSANKQINFLHRFHKLIQISASHYTLDGDSSERLMLKYYEYLLRLRILLRDECGIDALSNLESFPVDLDPSLREYHEKIASRVEALRPTPQPDGGERYYIHKTRPFFVGGRIYYEITFYRAVNTVSKFDRIIGFADIDMTDKYAASLALQGDSIDVLGHTMPITIIRDWEVSIRPCEFDNFARLFGLSTNVRANTPEYRYLMQRLTTGSGNLLDLMEMSDAQYIEVRAAATAKVANPNIFPALDRARQIVRSKAPGHQIVRYLMLAMHNRVLKPQYNQDGCERQSNLNVHYGCIPFDTMPFCTSLLRHNPRFWDLIESIDATGRAHELLARRVKNNVENHALLYTPVADLVDLGDVDQLIATYNTELYYKHRATRALEKDMGHVFMRGYEDDTVTIVTKLQEFASAGIDGHAVAVQEWLDAAPREIDDTAKQAALKALFSQSRVALIYGAAGTGKSTMVDHIANYFNDKRKLFLAHTNPAINNLRRRVTAQASTFRTIASQIRTASALEYDLLIIDECSTVSNTDLIKVLDRVSFKLLVLVGDVYQIESIQFGNWFNIIRNFVPREAVFELTTPYRTTNQALLEFWNKVRNVDDDIAEIIAHNGYSTRLSDSLFEAHREDEIILCLNYDGLYGINNVNRFLQSSNPGRAFAWRATTFKVGDPVLFNETERFGPVIFNNLKGKIVGIELFFDYVQFDVELDRTITEIDIDEQEEIEWMEGSIVRFKVYERDTSDKDDDSLDTNVPFQVAYAVSIHKAQGLEYDSVKVVITDANEEDISHSIFYTAVTRAREHLQIFWTPETQQVVLARLQHRVISKDVALLSKRRGLTPVSGKVAAPGVSR